MANQLELAKPSGRKCKTCGGPGPFSPDKRTKDGCYATCKACRRKYLRERLDKDRPATQRYYQANKEKIIARSREWQRTNRERANAKKAEWIDRNREQHYAAVRRWSMQNPEKRREARRAWRKANADRDKKSIRGTQLRRKGWTPESYEQAMVVQNHACRICGVRFEKHGPRRPHADHNHQTMKARAILCNMCNVLEGFLGKLPISPYEYVKRLREYKEEFDG